MYGNGKSLKHPSCTTDEILICARFVFCRKSNSAQLLIGAFFDIIDTFGNVQS